MFQIHRQLKADTVHLGRIGFSHVLLHRCAAIPWLILVPEVEERDIFELPPTSRGELRATMDTVSEFVSSQPGVMKVNVAAIGNMVPQLHVHIIGRSAEDFCWPGVVWGSDLPEAQYSTQEIAAFRQQIEALGEAGD